MIIAHFNYDLFLFGFIIYLFIASILSIYLGAINEKKKEYYGIGDVIFGILLALFIGICIIL